MKTITVYGPGCMKCKKAEENSSGRGSNGGSGDCRHVTDVQPIVAAGVMSTPAVAVDGVVKLSGRVPTTTESAAMDCRRNATGVPGFSRAGVCQVSL